MILEERFSWIAVGFSKDALSKQFEQAGDSPSPFFHTRIQYQMYQGVNDIRPMHSDQQWLCWAYLQTRIQLVGFVEKLMVMGWKKVLEFQNDQNETVIRQFYATLEVHAETEKLMWMTRTHKFEALSEILPLRYG